MLWLFQAATVTLFTGREGLMEALRINWRAKVDPT